MNSGNLNEDPKMGDPSLAQAAAEDGVGPPERAGGEPVRCPEEAATEREEIEEIIDETQTPG